MKKNNINIHIIGGTGKMGQWFKFFFENQNISATITGRDYLQKKELIKKADIIIISVPISHTVDVIRNIIPFVSKNQLIADIASVKTITMKAMEKAPCATLGMHPLFGPSIGSLIGQKIVFCRQKDNHLVQVLKSLFEHAGIEIIEMSAVEHDHQMAYVQALTHTMHLLYAKTILGQKKTISTKLQTPTFILHTFAMARVLNQDVELMADIQIYNPYFLPVFKSLFENAGKLLSILKGKNRNNFIALFTQEQKNARNFSQLSLLQANKILTSISQIPKELTQKIKAIDITKNICVGYLGPQGTYSHEATLNIFPNKNAQKISYGTLFEVFQAVSEEKIDFGIVPAENSIEGTILNTLDYLIDFSVHAIGSLVIPIHHQLLSHGSNFTDIVTVYSHPQALAQCRNWIKKHIPNAAINPTQSTTAGLIKLKKNEACIASLSAAKLHKVQILAKNIEDSSTNITKFYVISKNTMDIKELNNSKTLLFITLYDRVGILRDILNVFANHSLNLTKLESRPSREQLWDYHFFIEVDADQNNDSIVKALHELEVYCPTIRVLGQV